MGNIARMFYFTLNKVKFTSWSFSSYWSVLFWRVLYNCKTILSHYEISKESQKCFLWFWTSMGRSIFMYTLSYFPLWIWWYRNRCLIYFQHWLLMSFQIFYGIYIFCAHYIDRIDHRPHYLTSCICFSCLSKNPPFAYFYCV